LKVNEDGNAGAALPSTIAAAVGKSIRDVTRKASLILWAREELRKSRMRCAGHEQRAVRNFDKDFGFTAEEKLPRNLGTVFFF